MDTLTAKGQRGVQLLPAAFTLPKCLSQETGPLVASLQSSPLTRFYFGFLLLAWSGCTWLLLLSV